MRLALLFATGAWSTLSCSAVLGLDEPTHRGSGTGQESGGGGGSDNGSGGTSNGSSGGDGGTDSTTGGQGGMGGASGPGGSQAGGAGGSGGAVGTPDGGSAGGSAGAKDAGIDASKATCATLPLCDDFEAATVGSRPDAMKWKFDSIAPANAALVDSARFPGKKTVRIEGSSSPQTSTGFKNNFALNIGQVWFIRMRVIIPTALGNVGGGLMGIFDETTGTHLFLGISGGYLGYFANQNGAPDARVLPSAEANQLATGFKVPLTWMCIEAKYDAQNAQVQTWVDGTEIVALRADGVPTQGVDDVWFNMPPFKPKLTTVFFGWQGFYGPAVELWMDDLAVAATRIGCN